MILKMQTNSRGIYFRGVTLIELLVVLSMGVIVFTFAVPSMKDVSARANIRTASENISYAFRMAKNTARVTNRPVTLSLSTGTSANRISFTSPSNTGVNTDSVTIQDITLPVNVSVVADPAEFTFDTMGMIVGFSTSIHIVLASTGDSSHTTTVSIVNGLGSVTINRDSSS